MEKKLHAAVVGATGAVGTELIRTLESRNVPVETLIPLASERSLGECVSFRDKDIDVCVLEKGSFSGIDVAFFCSTEDIANRYAKEALESGACVIDTSGAFRLDERCPLVVPEVNAEDLEDHSGIVTSPGSLSIPLSLVLNPLHEKASVKSVVVTALESVSGAGKRGIQTLEKEITDLMNMREREEKSLFPRQLAFNVFPETGDFLENEYTEGEIILGRETQRILHAEFPLTATCIRVPVFFSHALSVHVCFERELSARDARAMLVQTEGVRVVDNPREHLYPSSLDAGSEDEVFVGRIRQDLFSKNAMHLWIVGDNLRKGGALNCVQICEELMARDLLAVSEPTVF
ncbi:MAG: aspartate-semialdehyde dehydrogenase [Desulfovibrio sp.]|nr:aspartate-semialdehyde dehydrogenase [Desulfovibrio sp.]